jgi:hypothetical protein
MKAFPIFLPKSKIVWPDLGQFLAIQFNIKHKNCIKKVNGLLQKVSWEHILSNAMFNALQ